jgi:hypothetical protein
VIYLKIVGVWFTTFFGFLFQQKYSKGWNSKLVQLLDSDAQITSDGLHCVFVGDVRVWTSNKWYAYAHPYKTNMHEVRPSIKTMIRLSQAIDKAIFK